MSDLIYLWLFYLLLFAFLGFAFVGLLLISIALAASLDAHATDVDVMHEDEHVPAHIPDEEIRLHRRINLTQPSNFGHSVGLYLNRKDLS